MNFSGVSHLCLLIKVLTSDFDTLQLWSLFSSITIHSCVQKWCWRIGKTKCIALAAVQHLQIENQCLSFGVMTISTLTSGYPSLMRWMKSMVEKAAHGVTQRVMRMALEKVKALKKNAGFLFSQGTRGVMKVKVDTIQIATSKLQVSN